MEFYYYSWKDCQYTGRSTGAYMIFYQGGTIDHDTHVTWPVSHSGAESEYNTACTEGMALEHYRVLINELFKKYSYIVPEKSPIIILSSKSVVCMANNGKDNKHKRNIARRVQLVRNGENIKCTRLTGVKEFCNGQTLLLRMLVIMT